MQGAAQATVMVHAGDATNCAYFDAWVDGHAPEAVGYDVLDEASGSSQPSTTQPNLPQLGERQASGGGTGLPSFVWRTGRDVADPARVAARAQQMANEQSLRVHAEGELDGTLYGHVLQVGGLVGVDGVGDTFGGLWYVDEVTHRFSDQGYLQRFSLLRNGVGDDLPPQPPATLPAL
jgi:hypothetical protein